MDWDKLKVFHAAAEAGSFTHAGEQLTRFRPKTMHSYAMIRLDGTRFLLAHPDNR
jgi:hypothetical protein